MMFEKLFRSCFMIVLGTTLVLGNFPFVEASEKFTKCEVKEYEGVPTLHINGEPKFATIVWDYWPGQRYSTKGPVTQNAIKYADRRFEENTANFAKTGCHIYLFTSSLGWTEKEGVYDYQAIEKQVEQILRIDPNAYLIPRFNMSAFAYGGGVCKFPGYDFPMASWWLKKHPEELIKCEDGSTIQKPSFASKIWRQDAGNALGNYINHFKTKPYGDRFIGYFVGFGTWAECNYFFEGSYPCYEKPMVIGFREWLRKEYKGDISSLREAWGNKRVTFNNAMPPPTIERMSSDLGTFIDPSKNRYGADFRHFLADLVAKDIIYFCKIVKEETDGNAICGSAYGGFMDQCGGGGGVVGFNHLAIRKAMDSPYVDFIENPHSYGFREIGTGDCSFMGVTDSEKLHGKLRINETDTRVFLHPSGERKAHGGPDDVQGSIEILKRDFGQVLCRSVGHWWLTKPYSIEPGRYTFDHPKLWKTIKRLNKIANLSIEYDRAYTGGIAMIVDEESSYYQRRTNQLLYPMLYEQRCKYFGRIGTPWDIYFHNDLSNPKMPDYKVYLFLNVFYLTKQEREEIKKKVCKDNNVVIWMYAPGFQTEEGFSTEAMQELTGMKVAYVNAATCPGIRITNNEHPVTKGLTHLPHETANNFPFIDDKQV